MKVTEFAKTVADLIGDRKSFAVATVVKTEGSTLGKPGFKVIFSASGEVLLGSLGGGCPDSVIEPVARKTLTTGMPRTVKVYLESVDKAVEGLVKSQNEDEIHVETNCGGTMEVFVEPFAAQERLILVGQGGKDDVEDALVKLGKLMDFEVVVFDHSPMLTEEPDQLIKGPDLDLSSFKFFESDSVVVLTKGARDVEVLTALSRLKLRYVGIMASRQRAADDLFALRSKGLDDHSVDSIRAPIGLDMGAVGAPEIALSIMAEIVAAKHGRELPHKALAKGEGAALLKRD